MMATFPAFPPSHPLHELHLTGKQTTEGIFEGIRVPCATGERTQLQVPAQIYSLTQGSAMTDSWVKATGSWFDGWGISALPSLGSPKFLHQFGALSLQTVVVFHGG